MSGAEFKNKLIAMNVKWSELAAKLEMSQQSLNAAFIVKDVKTGFVERVAAALDVDIITFFGGERIVNEVHHSVIKGDGNQVASGDNSTINGGAVVEKLLDELAELRKQNARLMEALLNK